MDILLRNLHIQLLKILTIQKLKNLGLLELNVPNNDRQIFIK
jgi:hypothetical protein